MSADEADEDAMAEHGENWLVVVAEGSLRLCRTSADGRAPTAYVSAATARYALTGDVCELCAGDVAAVGRPGEEGANRCSEISA